MHLFQLLAWLPPLALASPLPVEAPPFPTNGTALVALSPVVKQSFLSSCVECDLIGGPNGTRVACSCKTAARKYRWTTLSLNNCIGNGDGALAWQENGNFLHSCFDLSEHGEEFPVIGFRCKSGQGDWREVTFDISERIHNFDGNLACGV